MFTLSPDAGGTRRYNSEVDLGAAWQRVQDLSGSVDIVSQHYHRGVAPARRLDCASTPALDAGWAAATIRILSGTSLPLYPLIWGDTNETKWGLLIWVAISEVGKISAHVIAQIKIRDT